MARRKKKVIISSNYLKILIVVTVTIGIITMICFGVYHVFTNANSFKVKAVIVDPALNFINKRDYSRFIGKNIFKIDLKKNYKRLSYKYPQVEGLKIIRQFPDRIILLAKKCMPSAQIISNNQVLTISSSGKLLSTISKANKRLPSILGVKTKQNDIILGRHINGISIKIALSIINSFKNTKTLSSYDIESIDINNLSKIIVKLSDGLIVLMNNREIGYKISILNLLISQHKVALKNTKYIDLRFKEPVIGKK